MNAARTSLYVDVADRPRTERRPGVFWKVCDTQPLPPAAGGPPVEIGG